MSTLNTATVSTSDSTTILLIVLSQLQLGQLPYLMIILKAIMQSLTRSNWKLSKILQVFLTVLSFDLLVKYLSTLVSE